MIAFHSAAAARSLVIQVSSHTSNCTSAKRVGDAVTLPARQDDNPLISIHLKPSEHCRFQTQPETRKLLRFVWLLLEKTQPGESKGQGMGGGKQAGSSHCGGSGVVRDASRRE